MYLKRKQFNQDSYYDILDIIEERAFCEGYQYAQHEFAKKDEDSRKLDVNRLLAKIGTKEGKRARAKGYQQLADGDYAGGMDTISKHDQKRIAQLGLLSSAFLGGMGTVAAGEGKRLKGAIKYSAPMAALTAAGVGVEALSSKTASKILEKNNGPLGGTHADYEYVADCYKNAAGDMSNEAFHKKYGKPNPKI